MSRRGDYIRKRADGRWEGRYIVSRTPHGKAVYKSVYRRTYAETKDKLAGESYYAILSNTNTDQTTFDEIAQNWLTKIRSYKKYSTYVKYSSIYSHHIQPQLGNRKLTDICADDFFSLLEQKWRVRDNAGVQWSKSTLKSIRTVLLQIMEFGDHPISISSKSYIMHFSQNLTHNSTTIFTKEEQSKLQDFLLNDVNSYKLGIYPCMLTGLRLGEICALKNDHIDLPNKIIFVSQTV